jgi:hypothetical protein
VAPGFAPDRMRSPVSRLCVRVRTPSPRAGTTPCTPSTRRRPPATTRSPRPATCCCSTTRRSSIRPSAPGSCRGTRSSAPRSVRGTGCRGRRWLASARTRRLRQPRELPVRALRRAGRIVAALRGLDVRVALASGSTHVEDLGPIPASWLVRRVLPR